MKNLILLIAVMVVGACATTPTVKSVAGTYERIEDGDTYRIVFLDNGIAEAYLNGKKREGEGEWSISKDGELYLVGKNALGKNVTNIYVNRINKDGSITQIADIYEGKREDIPKEDQPTSKKIK